MRRRVLFRTRGVLFKNNAVKMKKMCPLICVLIDKPFEHRPQYNPQIEGEGPILDIIQVVVNPFFYGGVAAQAVYLRPTGDAGPHLMFNHVAGHFFAELFLQRRAVLAAGLLPTYRLSAR